jgi:hypothetical protein
MTRLISVAAAEFSYATADLHIMLHGKPTCASYDSGECFGGVSWTRERFLERRVARSDQRGSEARENQSQRSDPNGIREIIAAKRREVRRRRRNGKMEAVSRKMDALAKN